ncbi:DUF3226 domain-containing protein [Paenibacillus sp. SGZ-1009]|uniref:DUF3226 domain-containing protein n=1 Tax=Paenibacillus campi TaxID=3106031 RepID=UPI002AFFA3AC|nr:DUF3226 domain-containing protein [Paenibacillus sp. SGZ-1009]
MVEGPHDIEVVGRILKFYGLDRVKHIDDLQSYWQDVIPNKFPHQGNLLARVPIPIFFQNDHYSIAIHSAGGISKIPKLLRLTLLNILSKENEFLNSIGVIIDADTLDAVQSFSKILPGLIDAHEHFAELTSPGQVKHTAPNIGVHIFPDNIHKGTLEDMLLQAAEVVYSDILNSATNYVDHTHDIYKHKWGITDRSKIIVGCIANILKPGKANQVSIQDNDWISTMTRQLASVKSLDDFLKSLLQL